MATHDISRRGFTRWLAGGLLAGACPELALAGAVKPAPPVRLRAAAIQMTPKLADVEANLAQAEQLVRAARQQGAEWIILPEMFTTAAAFHPDMLAAIRPVDGAPARLLQRLARELDAVVGGSFLARHGDSVHNTFLLVFPDGSAQRHDKDYPTYWENCYYRGGEDDGVLETPLGDVGSALCWELIRTGTARRLLGRVRLVVGGSCWWTLPDGDNGDSPFRAANLAMARTAAPRLARMLGVPVVHGAHAGPFNGFYSPELPDVAYDSTYLGEAMIVDARGDVLARRPAADGAGVVVADVDLPAAAAPLEPVPDRFWIPEEMPEPWKASWERWFGKGGHYYAAVTEPFLRTGEVNEYVPEYLL
ncbi:carbon-nitrogen hydrolase family protein [Thioalbus denitrificans]|uniref:Putative amidohydrolase n=1 Tax=Thioalbus denitrificans TaxID=547122 RepID=A0A369BXT0_9GAMM|nr:carbon-nitrogen hydrolase family protein [Thioalbus denitrificans]RCX26512.1 putative amidohydrolase [Thioalbus denitrificans]